jgi:small subunit ribosomal protein S2
MSIISMKALLESGVHFGHRTHKWNPAMKPYIFTERNGIHIIDLQKTVKAIEHAYNLVRETVSEGGTVLFVGTKRQAQEMIQTEAVRCGMPYVTDRWLGGMLTNWRTIRQRINEMERIERMRDSGDFERITKKEALILSRKLERLEVLLGGIRNMVKVPDLLFVVDVQREETAIHEANLLNIPVIGMVDTNCDPRYVDYVIPSNDDAIRAIKLMVGKIADAVVEGKALRKEEEEVQEAMRLEDMRMPEEPELADEELLGEATLAKLAPRGRAYDDGEEESEPVDLLAEGEELVVEQFEVEPVSEVAEEPEVEEPVAEEPVAEEPEVEEPAAEEPVAEEPEVEEPEVEEPVAEEKETGEDFTPLAVEDQEEEREQEQG